MDLTVLAGDDDLAIRSRRAALFAAVGATGVERIDVLADQGSLLLDSVGSPSLFGGRRYVFADNIDALGEPLWESFRSAAAHSDAYVVAQAGSALSPRLRSLLKEVGTITPLSVPRGKGVGIRVDEMIRESGIRFDNPSRRTLVERTGHDLDRLSSILKQLQMAELLQPNMAQLQLLLGSTASPGVPWDLSDAIESGNLPQALQISAGLEPIPALAYLASRVANMGRVVDSGSFDVDHVVDLLKLSHRFQAEKVASGARRLGAAGSRSAWGIVVQGDRDVKYSKDASVAFDMVIIQLVRCFS